MHYDIETVTPTNFTTTDAGLMGEYRAINQDLYHRLTVLIEKINTALKQQERSLTHARSFYKLAQDNPHVKTTPETDRVIAALEASQQYLRTLRTRCQEQLASI